jgi:hypothetical protein
MKVPTSEARTKLPHLIKQLQRNPNVTYETTVHREVVAELKAPLQLPAGGEAAKRLLAILEQTSQSRSRKKVRVSESIKKHLYDKPHGTRA